MENGALTLELGPAGRTTKLSLKHFNGDTFSFGSIRENGNGLPGAIFAPAAEGAGAANDAKAPSVRLDFCDMTGPGTFARG